MHMCRPFSIDKTANSSVFVVLKPAWEASASVTIASFSRPQGLQKKKKMMDSRTVGCSSSEFNLGLRKAPWRRVLGYPSSPKLIHDCVDAGKY